MKIAVVGGGIFGTTTALVAARAGHSVSLYEKLDDILLAASGINQYRLHRGYHYPRSKETAQGAIKAEASFRAEFSEAIIDKGNHFYAIAKNDSFVDGEEFLQFCNTLDLSYSRADMSYFVSPEMIDVFINVKEAWFDPNKLRKVIKNKLKEFNVSVLLNTEANETILGDYDKVIIASYANLNDVVSLSGASNSYQYEVCEKPVVTMPTSFGYSGIVVMDGPFMCIDPLGDTNMFVLGNVEHAIHATNTGLSPIIPNTLKPLLNQGIVKNPSVTNYETFISHGSRYIPLLSKAQHVGSMFTVRTVLPKQEATDARPTLVTAIDDKYIRIFSGKIGNCVLAAEQAVHLL